MPLLALTDLSMTSFQIAEEFFLQCIETNSNKVFKKFDSIAHYFTLWPEQLCMKVHSRYIADVVRVP